MNNWLLGLLIVLVVGVVLFVALVLYLQKLRKERSKALLETMLTAQGVDLVKAKKRVVFQRKQQALKLAQVYKKESNSQKQRLNHAVKLIFFDLSGSAHMIGLTYEEYLKAYPSVNRVQRAVENLQKAIDEMVDSQ